MRKPFLLLAACFCMSLCYGQFSTRDSISLKPLSKSFATELNFNPFEGSLSLNNSLNQIKFRLFTSPSVALRLGVNVSTDNSLTDNSQPYGSNSYRMKDDKKSTTIGANIGIEKHFKGTRRLSPFLGFDLTLTDKSMKQELVEGQYTHNIDGGWYTTTSMSNGTIVRGVADMGYVRYGAALVSGFDFYMSRNFFFGYEFSFGYDRTKSKDVEIHITNTSGGESPGNAPGSTPYEMENSRVNFGPRLMNGIRLGYILK